MSKKNKGKAATATKQKGKATHGKAPDRRDTAKSKPKTKPKAKADTAEREAEVTAAEERYAKMQVRGKTPGQIRAVAVGRGDEALTSLCDAIIAGKQEEPAITLAAAAEPPDTTDADTDAPAESGRAADATDGGDAPAEADARPVVSLDELRAIDLELTGLVNRFREAAGEMNHLRGVLADLQRSRRAMGPGTRAPRPPREPGAPRGISLLTAAANLLAENGLTMNCTQIVKELADKGIWQSLNGKTPAATLYSAIGTEIRAKGDQARFVCEGKGQYRASTHGLAVFRDAQANAGPEA